MTRLFVSAAAGLAALSGSALAGEWVLNPAKCPDLREDRRDRLENKLDRAEDRRDRRVYAGPGDAIETRVDRGENRADRREDRRDEAVTVCPANAYDWSGRPYVRWRRPARPAAATVYWSGSDYYWRRPGGERVVVVVR